jgi:hypothetical protein
LLGLSEGNCDEARIRQAALQRYEHVRRYALGPQREAANRLLDEIAQAVVELTKPASTAADRHGDIHDRIQEWLREESSRPAHPERELGDDAGDKPVRVCPHCRQEQPETADGLRQPWCSYCARPLYDERYGTGPRVRTAGARDRQKGLEVGVLVGLLLFFIIVVCLGAVYEPGRTAQEDLVTRLLACGSLAIPVLAGLLAALGTGSHITVRRTAQDHILCTVTRWTALVPWSRTRTALAATDRLIRQSGPSTIRLYLVAKYRPAPIRLHSAGRRDKAAVGEINMIVGLFRDFVPIEMEEKQAATDSVSPRRPAGK